MNKWLRALVVLLLLVMGLAAIAGLLGRSSAPPAVDSAALLTIYSTTDLADFAPVIEDFERAYPDISVNYVELDASPLYQRFLREQAAGRPVADVMLSSAMDLQTKLVNDGYVMPHVSQNALALPNWARWRNEAFGFTFEPAVMVYNTRAMAGRPMPRSRRELLDAIRSDHSFWSGGVGTYDIATSSVGYLLASQDMRLSNEYSALLKAFGDVGVRREDNTATLLDELRRGELKVGYNLLGSYARRLIKDGAKLTIVYPGDYTLALLRTAVIPKSAPNPRAAHLFLEYLLSLPGQRTLETRTGLRAIRGEVSEEQGHRALSQFQVGEMRPITIGPGLLVYLDAQKRRGLLENWIGLVGPPAENPARPDH
ncbi:MAG: ABC transporter substrate-binding protein [Steroidobacteraceae bacterium]